MVARVNLARDPGVEEQHVDAAVLFLYAADEVQVSAG